MSIDLARLPIFPCKASDKSPLSTHGFYDAKIGADHSRWPLVGVRTGAASGFDVLDVDPKGLGWLEADEYRLPDTRRHRTRRGGVHLLFVHAEGLRKSESKIAPGVDVRADYSYAIFWPREGLPVVDLPLAPWPDWLLPLAMSVRKRARSVNGAIVPTCHSAPLRVGEFAPTLNPPKRIKAIIRKLEHAPKGERNGWLFRASCSLAEMVAEGHLTVAVATVVLEGGCKFNGLWTDPEDGPERCRATIASAFHRVEQKLLNQTTEGQVRHVDTMVSSTSVGEHDDE